MEGNLRLKIDWARLIVGRQFTLVLLCIWGQFSNFKPPGGLYLQGRFNEGFFTLPVWGAYTWRGLFSEFYGIIIIIVMMMMMMTTTTSNNTWSKCLKVIYLTIIIIIIERDLLAWSVTQIEEGFWPWWITTPKIYQMKDEKNMIHSNNFKFLLQLYLFIDFFKMFACFLVQFQNLKRCFNLTCPKKVSDIYCTFKIFCISLHLLQ